MKAKSYCTYVQENNSKANSYLTLQSLNSWLAKNNIWFFDSQPLPSLNSTEIQKPNL